jgi:alkanesulfonate monooxygenase SsuD/methylene tetrahydromethanopterin reductase-like flavin-dependent oxidoreductase (luciferase family)
LVLISDAIDEVVEGAKAAEAAGFDAVWLTDFYNRDAFVRMAMGRAPRPRASRSPAASPMRSRARP